MGTDTCCLLGAEFCMASLGRGGGGGRLALPAAGSGGESSLKESLPPGGPGVPTRLLTLLPPLSCPQLSAQASVTFSHSGSQV